LAKLGSLLGLAVSLGQGMDVGASEGNGGTSRKAPRSPSIEDETNDNVSIIQLNICSYVKSANTNVIPNSGL